MDLWKKQDILIEVSLLLSYHHGLKISFAVVSCRLHRLKLRLVACIISCMISLEVALILSLDS